MATPTTKKKQKSKPLTIRERKLIKALINGQPPTTAMKTAGYSKETAKAKAGKKVRESRIQETLQELMEKKGLTDDYLLQGLLEGTKATKNISCIVIAPNGEGQKDANSMTRDFVEVADFPTRHKYIETGFKIKGHLRDKLDISGDIIVEVVKFGAKD